MKVRIVIKFGQNTKEFRTGTSAIKFLKNIKADSMTLNNEAVIFSDIAELHQLELAEKRHNKAQGF